jgi:hypothetical protein
MNCLKRLHGPILAFVGIFWIANSASAWGDDASPFLRGHSEEYRRAFADDEEASEESLPRSVSETPFPSPRADSAPGSEIFQIRGREWYAHMSGNLHADATTKGSRLSMASDLDLGGHVDVPELQAYFNVPYLGRLYVDWWRYANTGDSTLNRTIEFAGRSFTGGSTIHSRFDLNVTALTYEYTLPTISLGGVSYLEFGLQLGAKALGAEASIDDPSASESARGTTYAVVLGGRALVQILPWLRAEAEAQGISLTVSAEKVTYVETYFEAVAEPLPWLFAGVGYKYVQITYRYEARLNFNLDFELSGAYLTVGVRF